MNNQDIKPVKDIRISAYLPFEEAVKITKLAAEKNMSVSALVGQILIEAIKEI